MIKPLLFLSLPLAGLILAIPHSTAQAEVFSVSGEVVRLDSPGSGSGSFGLAIAGGEVVARLQSSSGGPQLAEGPVRMTVEAVSRPSGASSGKTEPLLLVQEKVSTFGEPDVSGPFPITGPAAFSGQTTDRSQLYWAGNGHPPSLPAAQGFMTFRVKTEQTDSPASADSDLEAPAATTVVASLPVQEALVSSPVAAPVGQTADPALALAPKLAVVLEDIYVRLTWIAPSGALCHILASPAPTGPYQLFSSQTATADGPMSLLLPVTEGSAFLQLQIHLP